LSGLLSAIGFEGGPERATVTLSSLNELLLAGAVDGARCGVVGRALCTFIWRASSFGAKETRVASSWSGGGSDSPFGIPPGPIPRALSAPAISGISNGFFQSAIPSRQM